MHRINNIIKCYNCNAPLIYEELEIHECCTKKLIDMRFDVNNNHYYLFDGKKWYRWFPNWLKNNSPTESQQRNKTTDDWTEPKFLIFLLISYMISRKIWYYI